MEKLARHIAAVLIAFCATVAYAAVPRPGGTPPPGRVPDKTVVLTLDDAVKSHITVAAPLLKKLGFGATFFITHAWMDDTANFMSWDEVAQLHRMGFEIGNHSWTHGGFNSAESGVALGTELEMVEKELARVGVPKPISFAWCRNQFGPEAVAQLQAHGYLLARRGMQPELPYGSDTVGLPLDVTTHHPLLIPTTGDAYPYWTFENFKAVAATARGGKIAVLQFHGVPDRAHPWVQTPPENFRKYMLYLKHNGYHVVALRDTLKYYDVARLPEDPMIRVRYPNGADPDTPAPKMRALFEAAMSATPSSNQKK